MWFYYSAHFFSESDQTSLKYGICMEKFSGEKCIAKINQKSMFSWNLYVEKLMCGENSSQDLACGENW